MMTSHATGPRHVQLISTTRAPVALPPSSDRKLAFFFPAFSLSPPLPSAPPISLTFIGYPLPRTFDGDLPEDRRAQDSFVAVQNETGCCGSTPEKSWRKDLTRAAPDANCRLLVNRLSSFGVLLQRGFEARLVCDRTCEVVR